MKQLKFSFIFFIIWSVNSIAQTQCNESIRQVYFPIDELLQDKKVYCYKVSYNGVYKNDLYQIFWCEIVNNDTILNQEIVKGNFEPFELWKIIITEKGAKLYSHTQYYYKKFDLPEMISKIGKSQIFDWCRYKNKKYTYKIKNDSREFKRTRYSIQLTDSIIFNEEKYLCLEFQDKMTVKQKYTEKKIKKKLIRFSYFIEDVGMFKSVLIYPDMKIVYNLDKIISYDEWITAGNTQYT